MPLSILFLAAAAASEPSNPPPAKQPFSSARSLDEKALAGATAREDIGQLANSEQAASVSRSSVSGDVRTGNTAFSDNAFQNASGLTVVNANTGNNVAMNGAIVVNVSITPAR